MDDVKQRILEYLAVRKLRLERNVEDSVEEGHEQDRAGGSILLLWDHPASAKPAWAAVLLAH